MESKAIRDLSAYENEWSIKVTVFRKGLVESYSSNTGKFDLLKLILIDKEGYKIQAMLFNDAIQKFDAIIEKGKSYIIQNGNVRPVNGKYRNVNDEFELSFTSTMEVEEIEEHICYKLSNSFLQFNEVPNFATGDIMIDIIGLVVKVKLAFIINVKRPSEKIMKKREVILLDSGCNTMKLYLWGDLADNEGKFMEDIVHEMPVIAALNVKASYYEDELNISTSNISIIEINPQLEETNAIRNSTKKLLCGGGLHKLLGPTKRMMDAGIVKLDDIITNSVTKLYCAFIGKILKVQNKNNPWYEICNACGARVYAEGGKETVTCTRCEIKDTAFTRKYLLRLIVSDGNQEVYITIFDAAESFIGCTMIEYAETLLKTNKKELCQYYKKLMSSEDKEFKFLVKMDVKKREERTRKKLIVEEVYKMDAKEINEGSYPSKKLKIGS